MLQGTLPRFCRCFLLNTFQFALHVLHTTHHQISISS